MTDPERLQAAVDEALEFLGRTGTQTAEREQLAKRVMDRGDAKVRKQLGDAIYDLARRCIQVHERTRAGAVYGLREIATPSELKRSIGTYAARADVPAEEVAVADPSENSNAPLKQAIEVLERLEGRTDSWKSLVSWEAMARGDWEAAYRASDDLARDGSTEVWKRAGTRSAMKALIHLGRLAEAQSAFERFTGQHEPHEADFYNMAFVCARLGDIGGFERNADAMRACPIKSASAAEWRTTIDDQLDELCEQLAMSRDEARSRLLPESRQ